MLTDLQSNWILLQDLRYLLPDKTQTGMLTLHTAINFVLSRSQVTNGTVLS